LRSLTELMLMIVPERRRDMLPITTLVQFSSPVRFTSISRAKAAGSTSRKSRASAKPALLTRHPASPKSRSAARIAASTCA
jgi:hypothetical protein